MKNWLKNNADITLVALTMSFMVCIFSAFDVYISYISGLWFDVYDIIGGWMCAFAACFAILFVVGLITTKKDIVRKIYVTGMFALVIAVYMQCSFIEVPYGEMNEEEISWELYRAYDISGAIIWIGIFVAIGVLCYILKYEKMRKYMNTIMMCIFIVQLISGVISGITFKGFATKSGIDTTTKNEFVYSEGLNFNILVLDTMDSRVLCDYMTQGRQQVVADNYEDFTFYKDTLGAYNLTDYALPQILSGINYYGEVRYGEYLDRVYTESPLLNYFKDNDWSMFLGTGTATPYEVGLDLFDNMAVVERESTSLFKMTRDFYRLVLFRIAPTPLKSKLYYPSSYLGQYSKTKSIDGVDVAQSDNTIREYKWDNVDYYNDSRRASVGDEKNSFHLYHMKGIHAMRDIDNHLKVIPMGEPKYSATEETGVILFIVSEWIKSLKELGVYDNSVIIILGDHGASVEAYDCPSNFTQCPFMMIKGFNEKHDFQISDAPLSYNDLNAIYEGLLSGKDANTVVDEMLAAEGVSGYDVYSAYDLTYDRDDLYEDAQKVGRTRSMIYHKFTGDLGRDSFGSKGYELFTEYPSYAGYKIDATGVIY